MRSRLTNCSPDVKSNQEKFRYLNKENSGSERDLQYIYWDELVNLYGTKVHYYVYDYDTSLSGHDSIYGEHVTASFSDPIEINILANIPSEALMLSKFGYDMNSDFVGIVTIADWQSKFGVGLDFEPKSGDVIKLVETGWPAGVAPDGSEDLKTILCENRTPDSNGTYTTSASGLEWIRCPWIFEITERDHQDFSGANNMLMGHYIWMLKGKRFDYSYQPGIDPECHMDDVNDETFTGILSGGSQIPSDGKVYPGNANDRGREVWDYDDETSGQKRNDGIYGKY